MQQHNWHRNKSLPVTDGSKQRSIYGTALLTGIVSLVWLIFKTGRKPARIVYPCQKAAVVNVSIFLLPLLYPVLKWLKTKRPSSNKAFFLKYLTSFCVIAATCAALLVSPDRLSSLFLLPRKASKPWGSGVVGKMSAMSLGGTVYISIPHALAALSPHRVVSVHHSAATDWNFSCTSTGTCSQYYGSDSYVSQDVVNRMFASGLMRLTGTSTIEAAWASVLPAYSSGEVVAIKANFNDSIFGGGESGYADDDAYVDALPQVLNSIISGLISRGVDQRDIWVYDSSRYITDRFRNRIDFTGVRFFDGYGNGADVAVSTFTSADPTAVVDFSDSGYPGMNEHRISDVLVAADYLINIPIMKRHNGAGVTLSLKNHLGSINGFDSGSHSMHEYFYPTGFYYDSRRNPIVDINLNSNIRDKTILVVGDGLYGGRYSNNTPPERWQSFDNDSPNMLFFGIDPVAVDSVMYDYLAREGSINPAAEDILFVAAERGLGVHERWSNEIDRDYRIIDYLEIDYNEGEDPLMPVGLRITKVTDSGVGLAWEPSLSLASTITGYNVYRDGQVVGSTYKPLFYDKDLDPAKTYRYRVECRDALGRQSNLSDAVTATTSGRASKPAILPYLPLLLGE